MSSQLLSRLLRRSRTAQSPMRHQRLPLSLECLEERSVPAVFNVTGLGEGLGTVTNVSSGVFSATTLRGAIQAANTTLGSNTINLTLAGDYRITAAPNQTVLSGPSPTPGPATPRCPLSRLLRPPATHRHGRAGTPRSMQLARSPASPSPTPAPATRSRPLSALLAAAAPAHGHRNPGQRQ